MIFNMSTGGASTADKVKYNNTESGLQSTDVQGAIDEVNSSLYKFTLIADSGDFTNYPNNTAEYDFANSQYKEYCLQAIFHQASGEYINAMITIPKDAITLSDDDDDNYEFFPSIYQSEINNASFSLSFRSNCVYIRIIASKGWKFDKYRLKVYAR